MHLNEAYGLLKAVQLALNICPSRSYTVWSDKRGCFISITFDICVRK
jgi:hypothetical protein